MLGPIFQGVMLTGVIYFYSKSILLMINDYYREGFKTEMQKDLDKLEKLGDLSKSKENLNVEKSKDGIIVNKDVIGSPTIEGIPDIFHTPQKTSIVINYEDENEIKSDEILSNDDEILCSDVCPTDFSILDVSSHNEHNNLIQSNDDESEINHDEELFNSIDSSFSFSFDLHNHIAEDVKSNLKDDDEKFNKLKYEEKNIISKPLDDNLNEILKVELEPIHKQIDEEDKNYPNTHCNGNDNKRDTNNLNGKYNNIVTNHDDINSNDERKSLSDTNINYINPILQTGSTTITTENLNFRADLENVCNDRRKSVNEMVQYWDHQINLFEDNHNVKSEIKIPDRKRKKTIKSLKPTEANDPPAS